jgi:hypothetical protein
MKAINEVLVKQQGPSTLMYSLIDNDNFMKHKQKVKEMKNTFEIRGVDPRVPINKSKTIQLAEDRATEIEQ